MAFIEKDWNFLAKGSKCQRSLFLLLVPSYSELKKKWSLSITSQYNALGITECAVGKSQVEEDVLTEAVRNVS